MPQTRIDKPKSVIRNFALHNVQISIRSLWKYKRKSANDWLWILNQLTFCYLFFLMTVLGLTFPKGLLVLGWKINAIDSCWDLKMEKVVIFIFAFDFKQRYGEFTRFTNGFNKCYFFINRPRINPYFWRKNKTCTALNRISLQNNTEDHRGCGKALSAWKI